MTELPRKILRLGDLSTKRPTSFELVPVDGERAAMADVLGIPELKKFRFTGEIAPQGSRDWQLKADLGATVVQDCVVTLAPVTTRLDEQVFRVYSADVEEIDAEEVEMTADDSVDPLPAALDLYEVALEALALALPQYPRAEGAELGQAVYTEPGAKPMTDEDAKPFAGLANLREKLSKREG